MKNRLLWITFIATLIILLVWLAFFWQPETNNSPLHAASTTAETTQGGDFRLTSPEGKISLSDFRGKVVAIYFGYTFCPDVCPTALVNLAQAFTLLTPEELEKAKGLFVSVDPERDTLDVLKIYVPYFHPTFTGLSGSAEEVAQVAKQYGVRYMKQKPNSDGQYPVDHSSFTYLIDRNGKLAASLPHGTPPPQIVDRIRGLLAQ